MLDKYENFCSPISGATSFLVSLASNHTKMSFLPMLQFVNAVVRSCTLVISTEILQQLNA
jgi:importin-7